MEPGHTGKSAQLSPTEHGQPAVPAATSFYRDVLFVLIISLAARALFMLAMPGYVQSTDARNWKSVGDALLAGQNPYHGMRLLSWPPFWLQLIFVMTKIAAFFSIPFFRVLQSTLVLTELLVIVALVKLIREVAPGARVRTLIVLGIALNPAPILLNCQHGNFDVIVALWLVLFIYWLLRYQRTHDDIDWLCACLFLGLGILAKTVPLILFPLLAGGFRKAPGFMKFLGLALLLGPAGLGMSVIYVLTPADVTQQVLGYRSKGENFGVSGLFHMAGIDQWTPLYNLFFYLGLAGLMAAVSIWFWRRQTMGSQETILLAALILLLIPTLGPGYGPNYLYWYLPFLVASYAFFKGPWRVILAGFGMVIAGTYLFEYAILGSDGAALVNLLYYQDPDKQAAVSLVQAIGQYQFPEGQTLMRLPQFIASLIVLVAGAGVFWRSLKLRANASVIDK